MSLALQAPILTRFDLPLCQPTVNNIDPTTSTSPISTQITFLPTLPHSYSPSTLLNSNIPIKLAQTVTFPPHSFTYIETGINVQSKIPTNSAVVSCLGSPNSFIHQISDRQTSLIIPVTNTLDTMLHIPSSITIAYIQVPKPQPTPDHSSSLPSTASASTIDTITGDVVSVEDVSPVSHLDATSPMNMQLDADKMIGIPDLILHLPTWIQHGCRVIFKLPDSQSFLKGFSFSKTMNTNCPLVLHASRLPFYPCPKIIFSPCFHQTVSSRVILTTSPNNLSIHQQSPPLYTNHHQSPPMINSSLIHRTTSPSILINSGAILVSVILTTLSITWKPHLHPILLFPPLITNLFST